jgi:hypothetical protein
VRRNRSLFVYLRENCCNLRSSVPVVCIWMEYRNSL